MSIVTLLRGTSSTGTGRLGFVYVTGSDWSALAWEAAHDYLRQERYADAVTAFRRIAADHPDLRAQAELQLGSALVALGRHDEAGEAFASATGWDLTGIDQALADSLT